MLHLPPRCKHGLAPARYAVTVPTLICDLHHYDSESLSNFGEDYLAGAEDAWALAEEYQAHLTLRPHEKQTARNSSDPGRLAGGT